MKIYFAGSIRGGRDDKALYSEIIRLLGEYGTVLTEHIGDGNLSAHGETSLSDQGIAERDLSWLKGANCVVAEITIPSLGVGYELALAEQRKKPALCIYRETPGRRLSAMISGNKYFQKKLYSAVPELKPVFDQFFADR